MKLIALSRTVVLFTVLASTLIGCATGSAAIEEAEEELFTDPLEQEIQAYDRISAAILLGDPQLAIEAYEQARLEDPEDDATRVLLARLYIAAGDMAEAREILEAIPSDSDAFMDAKLSLALIERSLGNREAEVAALGAALQIDENNVQANSSLGEIFLEDKKYGEAEMRFKKALETDPEDFVALQGLGNTYLRDGKSQEAVEVFSEAIQADPDYSYNYVDRARAHVEQGDSLFALEDMNAAIELDPNVSWNYLDRGRILARRGDFDAARDDFSNAIDLSPQIFLNYSYRGQMNAYLGEYEAALADYESALELRPDYFPAYGFIGALYYTQGQYDQAQFFLNKAHEENPGMGGYILFAANAAFSVSRAEGRSYLEANLSKIERGSLPYEVGRFYLSGADSTVLNKLAREESPDVRAVAQFFLALGYHRSEQIATASALLNSEEQGRLAGSPESIVKSWILDEYIQ